MNQKIPNSFAASNLPTTAASRLILLLLNHNDAEDELTGE
jgi:hypothetical protein